MMTNLANHNRQSSKNSDCEIRINNIISAVPFKSTWEGECHFFIFLLVMGVKSYFLMLGGVFFPIGRGGGMK